MDLLLRFAPQLLMASLAVQTGAGAPVHAADEAVAHRNVLALASYDVLSPNTAEALDGLRADLRDVPGAVTVQTRFLDLARRADDTYFELADWVASWAGAAAPDLIVAMGQPAATFTARYANRIRPAAAVVFVGVDDQWVASVPRPARSAIVQYRPDYAGTVAAALDLMPDTQEVALVAGATAGDRRFLEIAQADLAPLAGRVRIRDIAGLPFDGVVSAIRALPDTSVILPVTFFADADGRAFDSREAFAEMAQETRRPMLASSRSQVGVPGFIGGHVLTYQSIGRAIGQVARRLLRDDQPAPARVSVNEYTWIFDEQQLARWQLSIGRLPAGALVVNRTVPFWRRYRLPLLFVTAALLVQAAFIGVLLHERRARRRAQEAVHDQLAFESMHAAVSRSLTSDETSDAHMSRKLEYVASFFCAQSIELRELAPDGARTHLLHCWRKGTDPEHFPTLLAGLPASLKLLREGDVLSVGGDSRTPPAVLAEWEPLRTAGLPSMLAAPLRGVGVTFGTLSLAADSPRTWSDVDARRLKALAETFGTAVLRRRDHAILEASEALNRAVLASLASEVAVVDLAGVVLSVNGAWRRAAGNPNPGAGSAPGESLLAADRLNPPDSASAKVAATVESVLAGNQDEATLEYSWSDSAGPHWSELRVRRLERDAGGAVVSHIDVTTRKRAEADVQRHLHELAHLGLVSGMGELVALVAHEVNQPLAAVLANAQSARRLMVTGQATPALLGEILDDIVRENRRASDAVHGIRRLLRKETSDWHTIDLNAVVGEVARILAGQASIAGVRIGTTLGADVPSVQGDRVQLQQVVLNLILNAVQSAAAGPSTQGAVTIRTSLEEDAIRLTVVDNGPGIPEGAVARLFEPFFSTKPGGLGIGLSISRTIVELHGGQLSGRNLPVRGAEFFFTLPVAPEPSSQGQELPDRAVNSAR
jgi:signal transduction histidine kinase